MIVAPPDTFRFSWFISDRPKDAWITIHHKVRLALATAQPLVISIRICVKFSAKGSVAPCTVGELNYIVCASCNCHF